MLGLCIVALATSCGGDGIIQPPPSSVSEFEQRVEDLRASHHIPAITAVISKGQQVVWVKAYGLADRSTERAAADTTVYHLASLTKPFVATVLLQLVERAKCHSRSGLEHSVNLSSPLELIRVPTSLESYIRRTRSGYA